MLNAMKPPVKYKSVKYSEPVIHGRCDQCGLQPFVTFTKDLKAELTFCLHHGQQQEELLTRLGWDTEDNTHMINKTVKADVKVGVSPDAKPIDPDMC